MAFQTDDARVALALVRAILAALHVGKHMDLKEVEAALRSRDKSAEDPERADIAGALKVLEAITDPPPESERY